MADRPYTNVGLRTFLLAMKGVLGEKWAMNAPVEVTEISCRALGDPAFRYRIRIGGKERTMTGYFHPLSPKAGQGVMPAHVGPWARVTTYAAATRTDGHRSGRHTGSGLQPQAS